MSDEIMEILKELQRGYLATLPDKISAMRELWQKREAKLLKTDFHKLKGTGRTYGFPELSLVGQTMEQICMADNPAGLDESVVLALELLHEIGVERGQGRVPTTEVDPRYLRILEILATLALPDDDAKKHHAT